VNPYVKRTGRGWSTRGLPLLRQFFATKGYWRHYDPDCQGMNELYWETKDGKVIFTNDYTDEIAIIDETVLNETITLL